MRGQRVPGRFVAHENGIGIGPADAFHTVLDAMTSLSPPDISQPARAGMRGGGLRPEQVRWRVMVGGLRPKAFEGEPP